MPGLLALPFHDTFFMDEGRITPATSALKEIHRRVMSATEALRDEYHALKKRGMLQADHECVQEVD